MLTPLAYVPLLAVVLGRLEAAELAAPVLPVPVPVPPCSEAPLSLPQLAVYQVEMAVLSVALEQELAHMVVRAPLDDDQTFLQKQAQTETESLDAPLHCD